MPEGDFDMHACVQRVRDGDETAAREFFRQLYPLVLRLVRAHLPRRTSEEDLCQMTFQKIFTNLDRYRGTAPVEHWVSRVTINTCLNQLRAERNRPELRHADLSEEQNAWLHSFAAGGDESHPADKLGLRELVDKLLTALNPADRLVIVLLYLDGCSLREVAAKTGWNVAVVKVRAFRARQKLKNLLDQFTMEERS